MKCPYLTKHDSCAYLQGTVYCSGDLVRVAYVQLPKNTINEIIPDYYYACPINLEKMGTKEDIEMLFEIHKKLEMIIDEG